MKLYSEAGTRRSDRLTYRVVLLSFLAILTLTIATRIVQLNEDPPHWISNSVLQDEAWWADSARGMVFFGDYFSDDFGTAFLMCPAYTKILEGMFRIFGVGLVPIRIVAASAAILTVLLVGLLLFRYLGWQAALAGTLLLGLSPFTWYYARIGLLETTQTFFIMLGAVLFLTGRRSGPIHFLSGVAFAVSIGIKPNSIVLGVFPFLAALLLTMFRESRRSVIESAEQPDDQRLVTSGKLLLATAGGAAALFLLYAPAYFRYRSELFEMAFWESTLQGGGWKQYLVSHKFLVSPAVQPTSTGIRLWMVMRYSPVLFLLFWLFGMSRSGTTKWDSEPVQQPMGSMEWLLTTWFLLSAILILMDSGSDNRWIIVIPIVSCLGAIFVIEYLRSGRIGRTDFDRGESRGKLSYFRSFLTALILLLPFIALLKPSLITIIMNAGSSWAFGADEGVGITAASVAADLVLVVLCGSLALFPLLLDRLRRFLLRYAPLCLLPLLLLEAGEVIRNFRMYDDTLAESQRAVERYLDQDTSVVLGHAASMIFLPYRVRTVRRTGPEDVSPPPNPDIHLRAEPELIIDYEIKDYAATRGRYDDLTETGLFEPVGELQLGPRQEDRWRAELRIFRETGD